MTSVLFSKNPLEWRLTDAIVIDEQDQPRAPKLGSAQQIGHVLAEFPWGPVDQVVRIDSGEKLIETFFGESKNPSQYSGYLTLTGKQWGPLEIVRVASDSDEKAKVTIVNTSSEDVLEIQALYPGTAGNEIKVRVAHVSGQELTIETQWGRKKESFTVSFENNVTPKKINSKYVTIAQAHEPSDLNIDDQWVPLTGGTTNQTTGLDWTGSPSTEKGLFIARTGSDGGVWFAGEHTGDDWVSSLRETVSLKRGVGIVQAKGDTIEEQVEFANKTADERIFFFGPKVTQYIDNDLKEVDVAPFAASVLVKTSPNLSIAEDRWEQYLLSIQGVTNNQALTRSNWIKADQAGLNLLEKRETGGYRWHSSITSNPESGKSSIVRRRMTDFVNENIAQALAPWRNKVQLPDHRLAARLAMIQRLQLMQGVDEAPDSMMIESYLVNEVKQDPTSIEYSVRVKLYGEMRYLIAHVMVGENVDINETEA